MIRREFRKFRTCWSESGIHSSFEFVFVLEGQKVPWLHGRAVYVGDSETKRNERSTRGQPRERMFGSFGSSRSTHGHIDIWKRLKEAWTILYVWDTGPVASVPLLSTVLMDMMATQVQVSYFLVLAQLCKSPKNRAMKLYTSPTQIRT